MYRIDDAPTLFPVGPLSEGDGAGGSGCVNEGGALADGIWFGYILSKDSQELTFDLACFFFGEVAVVAAAADGITDVSNDYYVRNMNPLGYYPPYREDAVMWWLDPSSGDFTPTPMAFLDWPGPTEEWPCPGVHCGVWLYINDGFITEAFEQYVP